MVILEADLIPMRTQLLAPLCGPRLILDRSVRWAAPVCVTVVTTGRPDLQVWKAHMCSACPQADQTSRSGKHTCALRVSEGSLAWWGRAAVFVGGLTVTPGPVCGPGLPPEPCLGAAVHFFLLLLAAPLQVLGWFSSFKLDLQDDFYQRVLLFFFFLNISTILLGADGFQITQGQTFNRKKCCVNCSILVVSPLPLYPQQT